MKKLSALAFALLVGVGLYGCGGSTPSNEESMMNKNDDSSIEKDGGATIGGGSDAAMDSNTDANAQ